MDWMERATLEREGVGEDEELACDYQNVVDWVRTSGLLKNQKCTKMPGRFMLRTQGMKSYTFKIVYNIKTKDVDVMPIESSNVSYLKFQDAYINVSPSLIKKAVLASVLEFELVTMLLADEL